MILSLIMIYFQRDLNYRTKENGKYRAPLANVSHLLYRALGVSEVDAGERCRGV